MALIAQNPWWEAASFRASRGFSFRRSEFAPLRDRLLQAGGPQVLVVGPRQAGKTTLLWQLVDSLLDDPALVRDPRQVVLFDFEDARLPHPRPGLREVVEAHALAFPEAVRLPCFFLFDEVGRSPRWDASLKQLHGEHIARGTMTRRFVVTDSASLLLDAKPTVAGRFDRFPLPFLSFPDFMSLRRPEAAGTTLREAMAGAEFDAYLERGGCPAYLTVAEAALVRSSLRAATERSVLLDLSSGRKPEQALRLFASLAADSGTVLNATERGADVGVPRQTVDRWLRTLTDCGLLVRLEPATSSARAGARLQPRIYCADPGIVGAFALSARPLHDDVARGRMVETAALVHFNAFARRLHVRLGYPSGPAEADFLLDVGEARVVVHVTAGRGANPSDAYKAARAAKALGGARGIVASRHPTRQAHDVNGARVVEVPLWSLCEQLVTVADGKELLRWLTQ